MKNFGRCLLFYLKYPIEMERLEADDPDLEGLPDAERVLEKVMAVSEAACDDVGDIIDVCAPGFEDHLSKISIFKGSRRNWRAKWGVQYRVAPKDAPDSQFLLGWWINPRRASIVTWTSCRDSRVSEDKIVRFLGYGIKSASGAGLVNDIGTVALGEAKIPVPRDLHENISIEPVLAEVHSMIAKLTPQHVTGLAETAGNQQVNWSAMR